MKSFGLSEGCQLRARNFASILHFPSVNGRSMMGTRLALTLGLLRARCAAFVVTVFTCVTPAVLSAQSIGPDNFTPADSEQLLMSTRRAIAARDYASAERDVSAALQIIKVNDGLYSVSQFPALELRVMALQAQRNWVELDRQFAYFEWLLRQTATADLDAFLSGTEVLNSLYLAAAADPDCPQNAYYLIAAKQLSWRAVSAIEQEQGAESLQLAPWLYRIVLNHYYQSASVSRRGMTSFDYKGDEAHIVNGWSLSKNESIAQSYRIGLELLQRIRHLYLRAGHNASSMDAQLILYIADWERLFEHETLALEYYRRAWHSLQRAEPDGREWQESLATPQLIPASALPGSLPPSFENGVKFTAWSPVFPGVQRPHSLPRIDLEQPDAFTAIVQLTGNAEPISARILRTDALAAGEAQLALQSATPEMTPELAWFQREVELLQFRPAIVGGEWATAREIRLSYSPATAYRPGLVVSER
jgi:hypothetical protein